MPRTTWDEKKKTEWERNAPFWIRIMREHLDPFRNEVTNATLLNVLPQKGGKRILDVGCGEGYLSRLMAQRKMKVWGVDLSPALIKAAKEEEQKTPLGISYKVADMRKIPFLPSSFDVVVSNQSMHEIDSPQVALLEFSRLLARKGKLILLFLHPCFDFWQKKGETTSISGHYFKAQKIQKPHYLVGGIQSPAPYFYLHLPLEEWVRIINEAGFSIKNILEPKPPFRLMRKLWWKQNFNGPRFILIEAEKR